MDYAPGDHVLKVRPKGQVTYRGRLVFIGEGVAGEHVAIRPTEVDGVFAAYFCHKEIRKFDLRQNA